MIHITHRDNVASIKERGISTAYSQGARPSVWGVSEHPAFVRWAVLHCLARHGWSIGDLVGVEFGFVTGTGRKHGKAGLYYSRETVPPARIRDVWDVLVWICDDGDSDASATI